MATLWITVFEHAGEVALGDPIQELTVTFTSSTQSAAITGTLRKRKRVRIFSDADCNVSWGANPTASGTTIPMGAENPEYFDIEAGYLIAAVTR